MTTRAKQAIVLILAVVAMVLIATSIPMRSTYDQYVCTACGLKRSEYKKRIGPIAYRKQITLERSPISLALNLGNCPHNWLLYRFGHSSGFLIGWWKSHLDGGSRSYLLRMFLSDKTFAGELAQTESPSQVLSNLFVCLNDSQELDGSLESWWLEPGRSSLSDWWKTNQAIVHTVLVSTNR